jgi:hypothetical protein
VPAAGETIKVLWSAPGVTRVKNEITVGVHATLGAARASGLIRMAAKIAA